jgi:ribosome-associated toxin RatA of RatAB toxin-antitoxin module
MAIYLTLLLSTVCSAAAAAPVVLPESLRNPASVGRDADAGRRRNRFSAAQWKELREGRVISSEEVPESGQSTAQMRSVRAAMVVPHPPEHVWRVLVDFEQRPKFLPGAEEMHIEAIDGNRVWLEERLQFLLVAVRFRVINTLEPERGLMSWVLDKSIKNDIADSEGAWQLTVLEEAPHTLVTYRAWIDTGQPVPGFLALPDLLEGLRTEVQRRAR